MWERSYRGNLVTQCIFQSFTTTYAGYAGSSSDQSEPGYLREEAVSNCRQRKARRSGNLLSANMFFQRRQLPDMMQSENPYDFESRFPQTRAELKILMPDVSCDIEMSSRSFLRGTDCSKPLSGTKMRRVDERCRIPAGK